MTRHPITRSGLLLISLLLPVFPLAAEEPNARELLRDALYSEEVTRDPAKAAESYRKVLALYDEQQPIAAAALFRLAEVTRKQGNKDEAVRLYQRLLREFPAAEAEGKQARENLATLGAKDIPGPGKVVVDEDEQELLRVKELAVSSPDRVREESLADEAVKKGQVRVVEYLLESGFLSKPADFLGTAVASGNVRMVDLLLKKAGEIDQYKGRYALWVAVERGYKDVALVLLKHKIDPNFLLDDGSRLSDGTMREESPLHIAAKTGDLEMSRALLEHGADPNLVPTHCSYPGDSRYSRGTPLHEAASQGPKLVRLLLEKGAKADAQAAVTGLTPLHFAASSDQPEAIKLLLDHGAPIEAGSKEVISTDPGRNSRPAGETPLMLAIESGAQKAAKVLLEKGADPNAKDATGRPVIDRCLWNLTLPVLKLLLEHDADPNLPFGNMALGRNPGQADPLNTGESEMPASPLASAANKGGHPGVITALLDAGAVPGKDLPSIIRGAGSQDEDGSIIRRLVSFQKDDISSQDPPSMERWTEGATAAYLESLVFPGLSRKNQLSIVFPQRGRVATLLEGNSEEPLPALASLLLKNLDLIFDAMNGRMESLSLVRKEAGDKWTRIPIKLDDDAPLPELRPHDLLEVKTEDPQKVRSATEPNQKNTLTWALRRRVSFPITVEVDGQVRALAVRGDLFTFDPTKNEVPLTGASSLAGLLWRPETDSRQWIEPSATLVRKGWPDIRVPWGQSTASDLPLEAGDKLVVTREKLQDENHVARRQRVVVASPGLPFAWATDVVFSNEKPMPASIPTLMQALAEIMAGDITEIRGAPSEPDWLGQWLTAKNIKPRIILPHPDYSRIRIRRLKDDGGEEIIPVDLASVIAASSEQTTAAQAREADLVLQAGDIVELPTLEGEKEPWTGPTPKTAAFFAKALGYRVQIQDASGALNLREVNYSSPRFVQLGGSVVPIPPRDGVATLKAHPAITGSQVEVFRPGWASPQELWAISAYLRDGDTVKLKSVTVPPGARPPRPRSGPTPTTR